MNVLQVFAMREEAQEVFTDRPLLFTGIGKVNAAYALGRYLHQNDSKPDIVINMGTAGSHKYARGQVVNCTRFIQRDMDVTALGFEKYKTPFSDDPALLEYGERAIALPEGLCGSGDSFDSTATKDFDVVDMEAYALALICQREKIPFLCLKYISDGADSDSAQDWNEALVNAAKALHMALEESLEELDIS